MLFYSLILSGVTTFGGLYTAEGDGCTHGRAVLGVDAAYDVGRDHERVSRLHVLEHKHSEGEVVDECVPRVPLRVLLGDDLTRAREGGG